MLNLCRAAIFTPDNQDVFAVHLHHLVWLDARGELLSDYFIPIHENITDGRIQIAIFYQRLSYVGQTLHFSNSNFPPLISLPFSPTKIKMKKEFQKIF